MTLTKQPLEYTVLELFDNFARNIKATPLNLGGIAGSGGGVGGPPGGFVGQLPQKRVAYDSTEAATLFTPPSGASLVDNLNHIRYRIGALYSGAGLIVEDYDGVPSVTPVNRIVFSGATITNQGYGRVLVAFSGGGGGGGTALTVLEADGSPSVSNVDQIAFSGISIADQGSGDVLAYIEPQRQGVATRDTYYPVGDGVFLESGLSYYGLYPEPHPTSTDSSSGVLSGGEQEFAQSITAPGIPGTYTLGEGVYLFYVRARRLSGTKNVKIKVRIYTRTSGGSEALLVESNETPNLTGSFVNYTLAVRGESTVLATDTRLVVKYVATPYDSGTNPTAEVRFNNSSGYSRVELPTAVQTVPIFYTGGWKLVSETWTRTGNHTFTISGDKTAIYRKGVKVRYRDGGSDEYGVIYSATHSAGTTTVTLFTNSGYTMAAATITNRYISYEEKPQGFPEWFSYSVTYSASGSMTYTSVTTEYAKFRVSGNTVFWTLRAIGTTGGTASTQINATLPCAPLDIGANGLFVATCGDTAGDVGRGVFDVTNSLAIFFKSGNVNWGLGASRTIIGQGFFEY